MFSRLFLLITSCVLSLFILNWMCGFILAKGLIDDGGIRGALYYKQRVPHPFLGYVTATKKGHHPVWQNNPVQTDSDTFKIGVFGGSVAYYWSLYLRTEPGETVLQDFVAKKFHTSKKVEVIDFADGGWYQPQPLIAALLYGKNLDLAISMEGVNELRRSIPPEFPLEFPRARFSQVFFLNTFESHVNLLLIDLTVMVTSQLDEWAEQGWFRNLNAVLSTSIKKIMRARLFELDKQQAEPETLTNLWAESSLEQSRIFTERKIPHVLFIQPIPCIAPTGQVLKDEYCAEYNETGVASVQKGLEIFRQQAKLNKLPFTDLSDFHPMDHGVYFDDVHFTLEGQKLLTARILQDVDRMIPQRK